MSGSRDQVDEISTHGVGHRVRTPGYALEGEDASALELDRIDVGCELEVPLQRIRGSIRVVRSARLEQLDVELLVPVLERALREQHRPIALAAVPCRTDQAQQPERARRLVEGKVKRAVCAYRRADVAAFARLVVRGQMRARRLGVRRLEQL